jgi:hypothetical protein
MVSNIVLGFTALWFVLFSAYMDASKGNFYQRFMYKMVPMVLPFLLGLVAFKII